MPRVVHFELPADDPDRAVKFYETAFGWKIQKWDGPMDYWLVMTGPDGEPGINGGIMRRMDTEGTRNTVSVPSVDEYTEKILAAGGTLVMPKEVVPGVGTMASFRDSEGNLFGIIQFETPTT